MQSLKTSQKSAFVGAVSINTVNLRRATKA